MSTARSVNHRWEVPYLTKQYRNEKLDRKTAKSVFLRLCTYVMKYWYLFIPAVILTLLSNQLSLMGPQFSGDAVDAIARKGGVDFDAVWYNVIRMLICYLASAVLSYCLATLMIFISQKIVYTMRKQLFEKLTSLPVSYFDTHPTGDIISHISYDIDTINSTLSHDLVQIMTSVYTVVGSLIFMWNISKPLILVFCITVPASVLFTRYRSKRVRPLFHTRSKKLGELNGYAEEMLSGCRTISAYAREEEIGRRFNERNTDSMDAYYKADYYGCTMGPTVNFINNFSISLIMIIGGILYMFSQNGTVNELSVFFITLGGVSKFVQYSRKFAGPINEFANILHELQSAFSAAERIFKIIDEEPEPKDKDKAEELTSVKGEVEFKNAVFGYTADKTILKGISFKAEPGKTVAVVGPTGAGKTTIINLLMRFYDLDSGEIYLDGRETRNITRRSLRRAYTMVLQDTWLFGGTIYENIAYGREDATEEEIRTAAKAAKIDRYIESLPEGYNTVLSDGGVNISKGQKQLITIARAMVSDSRMLILDEATSNVDSRTEIKIQEAMNELMKDRTCFVIAHRLSTVKNADLILVIQDGKISECGNHEELLNAGGFYSTLYNSQFV
ncbi:MAG: ABC transporter ATP-binding protein [Ruminococcaceae bacterium]|nr:ABC transporter ATP-binding protein [Oscillospiraceae bacterium]